MANNAAETRSQADENALHIDAVEAYGSESEPSGVYVSADADRDSDRGRALANVLRKKGESVFFNSDALRAALQREGLTELDALKLCLMARTDGFRQLITRGRKASHSDVDRFIQNARAQTGFSGEELLRLAKDVCYVTDLQFDARVGAASRPSGAPYVIPAGLYQEDLQRVERTMRHFFAKQGSMDQQSMDRLIQLVRIGVPRAKYLYGLYLFTSAPDRRIAYADSEFSGPTEGEEVSRSRALTYLAEAAEEGDPSAAAMMGDFLYHRNKNDDWDRSYDYYTGYGASALNDTRKSHIVSILNRATINRGTILSCAVLLMLFLAAVLLSPGKSLFPGRVLAGVVCFLAALGWSVWTVYRHNKNPFIKLDSMPVVIFFCWFAYTAMRLL